MQEFSTLTRSAEISSYSSSISSSHTSGLSSYSSFISTFYVVCLVLFFLFSCNGWKIFLYLSAFFRCFDSSYLYYFQFHDSENIFKSSLYFRCVCGNIRCTSRFPSTVFIPASITKKSCPIQRLGQASRVPGG